MVRDNWCIFMVEKSRIKGSLTQAMLYLKKLNLCYFLLNTHSVVLFFVYSVAMGRMFKLVILCGDKSRDRVEYLPTNKIFFYTTKSDSLLLSCPRSYFSFAYALDISFCITSLLLLLPSSVYLFRLYFLMMLFICIAVGWTDLKCFWHNFLIIHTLDIFFLLIVNSEQLYC